MDRLPNDTVRQTIKRIPGRFMTDGCSHAPDSIFGVDIWWACRIHDWRYCTRAQRAGSMTQGARRYADKELGWNVRDTLPLFLRWIGWGYWRVTRRLGGMSAFDSCGAPAGEYCRHNLPMPDWMAALQNWAASPSAQ